MKWMTKIYLEGLLAILPLSISIFAVYWLAGHAEAILGSPLKNSLPDNYYIPGMGVVAGVVVVFLLGLLLNLWFFRKILALLEDQVSRIPLIKTVYGSVKDLLGCFGGKEKQEAQGVAIVTLPSGARVLGIITRRDFSGLPANMGGSPDAVAVYLPMSYQLGGYTIFVPKSSIELIDMEVEDAMRFAVTAGMSGEKAIKQ